MGEHWGIEVTTFLGGLGLFVVTVYNAITARIDARDAKQRDAVTHAGIQGIVKAADGMQKQLIDATSAAAHAKGATEERIKGEEKAANLAESGTMKHGKETTHSHMDEPSAASMIRATHQHRKDED